MNLLLRNNIAPLITFMVLITVSIQVYWNFQNYQNNKQQIISNIQVALDNSINNYYNEKAKSSFINDTVFRIPVAIANQSLIDLNKIKAYKTDIKSNTINLENKEKIFIKNFDLQTNNSIHDIKNIQHLAQKIIISIREDKIELNKLATYLNNEFARKQLNFEYAILYKKGQKTIAKYHEPNDKKFLFSALSKSSYLPKSGELKLFFPDIFVATLKKGLTGIILSFLFFLSIIFCLFYLLSVIRQQKQLAIIKNDFISNISHELKTPIAVVVSALEGIEYFNTNNESEKTKKYLAISKQHLTKLHQIVEKILETSALESDKLHLQKSNTEIVHLINHIIEKLKIST